jgi:hypothetical protein
MTKSLKMSAELAAMLSRPRNQVVIRGRRQAKLDRIGYAILAKKGFFKAKVEADVPPAECCGVHGLRPAWHGRA